MGGRPLMATHLGGSIYLANERYEAVNKYELTVFIRMFQGTESCALFQGHSSLPVNPSDLTAVPHPRFSV
jgi:hypothetical protein